VAAPVIEEDAVWGNYTLDWALEAMLAVDEATGEEEFLQYVLSVMQRRYDEPAAVIPYQGQPFCHLNYAVLRATGDTAYVEPFVQETCRYRREVTRSAEGAIAHRKEQPGRHLLVDMLQDYASRMARAGRLAGDRELYGECVEQHRLYRRLLRDPGTGLWRQGRGWRDEPLELSPGAWSRGHGWLIRGMVASLDALPGDSEEYAELQGYLRELADALLLRQNPEGMWHTLLHLPPARSAPETSGTAMICHGLDHAIAQGHLDGEEYRQATRRAYEAVARRVGPNGTVRGVCRGPGPLESVEPYLDAANEPDNAHGPPAVLFACAGRIERAVL
jgi:rhamnogalacturonyl hydrolase YesR